MEIDRALSVQLLKVLIHYKTMLDALDGKSTVVDAYVLDDLISATEDGLTDVGDDLEEVIRSVRERVVIDMEEDPEDPGHFRPVRGTGEPVEDDDEEEDDEGLEDGQEFTKDVEVDGSVRIADLHGLSKVAGTCVRSVDVKPDTDVTIFFDEHAHASLGSFIVEDYDENQVQIFADFLCLDDGELLIGDRTGDVVQWHVFSLHAATEDWMGLLEDGKTYEVK